jgi:hypothetical protein
MNAKNPLLLMQCCGSESGSIPGKEKSESGQLRNRNEFEIKLLCAKLIKFTTSQQNAQLL